MGLILQPFEDLRHKSVGLKEHINATVLTDKINWGNIDIKLFCKQHGMKYSPTLRVWGVRRNNKTSGVMKKAKVGDTVYFIAKGTIHVEATLVSKIIDDSRFNDLWVKNDHYGNESDNFNRIYLIDDVINQRSKQMKVGSINGWSSNKVQGMSYLKSE